MSKEFGKIALLQGGDTPEREVSLMSASQVATALDELCEEVVLFDPSERDLIELAQLQVDAVFNIIHGGYGENGLIQATLEMLNIPFTGSRHLASALAMDKHLSKSIWSQHGLPTPLWRPVDALNNNNETLDVILLELGTDLFVKPNSGGSSLCAKRVQDREQLEIALKEVLAVDSTAMVEQHVEGIEVTYGILDEQVLPGIRIEVATPFYDYEAKYQDEATKFICPPQLPRNLDEEAQHLVAEAFSYLGCEAWGRVDLLVSGHDLMLLEVNTVPGMTSHSLVPHAAAKVDIDFTELVKRILAKAR